MNTTHKRSDQGRGIGGQLLTQVWEGYVLLSIGNGFNLLNKNINGGLL